MAISGMINKSDWVGILASGLCMVHCLATPFLFVTHAAIGTHAQGRPFWWGFLDIVFLLFSFLAVYWSVRKTSRPWVKHAFWILWGLLALIIVNEKWGIMHLAEVAIYFPALGLVFLHFYNLRYGKCEDDNC